MAHNVEMTSMRRRYVASTSLRRHVPAGNLAPPQNSRPWPPQYSKPSYAYVSCSSLMFQIGVWVCAFVLPAEYDSHSYGAGLASISLVIYIVGGVWFVQLILDRYYR